MTKGEIATKEPIPVDVKSGEDYFWCSCGKSANQPFCDGSHKDSEFAPVKWTAEADGTKYFCGCKQTDGQPFCDGSHQKLTAPAAEQSESGAPSIDQREDGPLVVKHLPSLTDADGNAIEAKPVMALCRCGQSKNKPFCDGSHTDAGFTSARETDRPEGKVYSYEGEAVTVYYNKLLCSHAAECGRLHVEIFNPAQKPWIQPDKGSVDDVREVIGACPSGALSMSEPGSVPQHIVGDGQTISIERHGPYHVQNIAIDDAVRAEQASEKKYVLCRCGLSKNKPFCDGTHRDEKWRDNS